MPRRVWTYAGLGWDFRTCSPPLGAAVLAERIRRRLLRHPATRAAAARSTPIRGTRRRWSGCRSTTYGCAAFRASRAASRCGTNPDLREEVDAGQHYLPGTATGGRETIVTSPRARGPNISCACRVRAGCRSWRESAPRRSSSRSPSSSSWPRARARRDHARRAFSAGLGKRSRARRELHDIGDGIRLPDSMTGSRSHAWWAMVVLLLVDASIFASFVFLVLPRLHGRRVAAAGSAPPAIGVSVLAALGWACWSAPRSTRSPPVSCEERGARGHDCDGNALLIGACAIMACALSAPAWNPLIMHSAR